MLAQAEPASQLSASSPFTFLLYHLPPPQPLTVSHVVYCLVTEVSPTQVASWAFPTLSHQPRMFQTVPDTSSYVKVRHDSVFKQVMTPRATATQAYGPSTPFRRSAGRSVAWGAPDQMRVAQTLGNPWLGRHALGPALFGRLEVDARGGEGGEPRATVGSQWVLRSRPRALSRFQVKCLGVLGGVQVSLWTCVRGCVNATRFSHRFDTPSVLKPTFLSPTRPSKAQIAIFDSM